MLFPLCQTSYTYGETTDDNAYQVEVAITYQTDLGNDTSRTITLMHEENRLAIVEIS